MSSHSHHHPSAISGPATLVMLLVMLAAAVGGSLISRNQASAFPAPDPAVATSRIRWAPNEVQQLIGAIEASEDYGLDPDRYGLAALKSELVQASEIWGQSGTHQLDVLAHASAVSLANDYRRQAGLTAVTADEVESARAAGKLRSWLVPARG